jgi:hypothetical protein
VARASSLYKELHPRMWNMSTIQNWQKSIETSVYTYKGGKINLTVC